MKFEPESLVIDRVWANRFDYPDETLKAFNIPEDECHVEVIGIDWVCNLGFGTCQLRFMEDGTRIVVDSECMCNNENKEFLRALLNKICDEAEIEG